MFDKDFHRVIFYLPSIVGQESYVEQLEKICPVLEFITGKIPLSFSFPLDSGQHLLLCFDDLYSAITESAAFKDLMMRKSHHHVSSCLPEI